MPAVSVIIVSYKVRYYIEQCLDSVLRSVPDAEIFVVDNNSQDGSVEYLQQKFPDITIIANQDNAGFGRANNMALARATGQYVLFLNPDTVVAENTIPGCMDFMQSHPQAGGLGVRMLYANGQFALESRRSLPTPSVSFWHMTGLGRMFPNSRLFAKYHLTYLDERDVCGIEVISGAFMFVRREALCKTGGFDESFFMYGEDIDLSYRILQQGYTNWYLPLPIIHYKGESTNKTSYSYAKAFYNAMLIFFNKHFHKYSRLFAMLVWLVVSVRKLSTFVGQNLLAHRRKLTDYTENCIFVGPAQSYPAVSRIVSTSKYLRRLNHLECSAENCKYPDTEQLTDTQCVIFDMGAFQYTAVMDWMYRQAKGARRYSIGFYHPKTGKLITQDETLC